ncbi:MAG: hypothetical protein ACR2I5_14005 [Candidatus Limnocylindria bacterium]
MNTQLDFDRILDSWLADGPSELPDRAVSRIVQSIDDSKRGPIGLPWREMMNRLALAAASLAAVVLVVVIGFGLFSGGGMFGPGAGATPSPTPSATPATPAPTDGSLAQGPHVLSKTPTITVAIPAPGWFGELGGGILTKNENVDAPDGAGMIVFAEDLYVYRDPCEWSTTKPETPATTVDELVAALSAQSLRDASAPVDITVDGYTGTSITLHVPDDAVFGECDQGTFGSWGVAGESTPGRYAQDPGQIDELWIMDVNGVLVVIDTAYYEATPTEHVDEMRAIVQSATFGQ